MAVAEARVDAHADRPAVAGALQRVDHRRRADVGQHAAARARRSSALSRNTSAVSSTTGGVAAGGKPAARRAQHLVAADGVDPEAGVAHHLQHPARRARLHRVARLDAVARRDGAARRRCAGAASRRRRGRRACRRGGRSLRGRRRRERRRASSGAVTRRVGQGKARARAASAIRVPRCRAAALGTRPCRRATSSESVSSALGKHGLRYARHITGELPDLRLVAIARRDAGRLEAARELGARGLHRLPRDDRRGRTRRTDRGGAADPAPRHRPRRRRRRVCRCCSRSRRPRTSPPVRAMLAVLRQHPIPVMVAQTLRYNAVVRALLAALPRIGPRALAELHAALRAVAARLARRSGAVRRRHDAAHRRARVRSLPSAERPRGRPR